MRGIITTLLLLWSAAAHASPSQAGLLEGVVHERAERARGAQREHHPPVGE